MKLILSKFLSVLGIVILFVYAIAFAWENYGVDNTSISSIVSVKIPIFVSMPVTTTLSAIILFTFMFGTLAGFLYSIKINAQCDDVIMYYKNKYKRLSMGSEDDAALIENLQRKVASLEIALEEALNKNN